MVAATVEDVRAVLATVKDPEIRRPITELGMVDALAVGDDGVVSLTVLLTIAACPMRDRLTTDVTTAVRSVRGVTNLQVTLGVRTDEQRTALRNQLQGGPGKEIPFARPDSLTANPDGRTGSPCRGRPAADCGARCAARRSSHPASPGGS